MKTHIQKLRERHSRLVSKIFGTPYDSKEYWELDKEIDSVYNEIITRDMKTKEKF